MSATRADLAALEARRARGETVVGALLALEGAHAAEGLPENLERLFEAGYRMAGLTHFFDNAFAGSAHGVCSCSHAFQLCPPAGTSHKPGSIA